MFPVIRGLETYNVCHSATVYNIQWLVLIYFNSMQDSENFSLPLTSTQLSFKKKIAEKSNMKEKWLEHLEVPIFQNLNLFTNS